MVKQREEHGSPPLFSKWRTWYWVVIGTLVLLIGWFYLFMRYFE